MQDTEISWTDDTNNPWHGCHHATGNPACDHCYAEALDRRHLLSPETHWGTKAPRFLRVGTAVDELRTSARRAMRDGRPRLVFIGSMMDIFEDGRPDLDEPRARYLAALDGIQRDLANHLDASHSSPPLVPLLLTKRPHVALEWARSHPWPLGAWLGVSVPDQANADRLVPEALEVAALTGCEVFLSIEPLLGAVDLSRWLGELGELGAWTGFGPRVDWVIVGGESGRHARPMHPEWVRSLRDQCAAAGVPFHFKQWGEWAPRTHTATAPGGGPMLRLGKAAAGRLLDGRTHDDRPGSTP